MATKLGIENVKRARDFIAVLPDPEEMFCMDRFFHPCGTPACAAGNLAAAHMFGLTHENGSIVLGSRKNHSDSFEAIAAAMLIREEDAVQLFESVGSSRLDLDIEYQHMRDKEIFIARCNLWLERNEA